MPTKPKQPKQPPAPASEPKLPSVACPPPHELRADVFLKAYLDDRFEHIHARIRAVETKMSKLSDRLTKIEATEDAAIARVVADLQKLRDELAAKDDLSPEDQATLDRVEAKLADLDAPAPDTGGGETPPADVSNP
jgi:hypothetical protein